MTHRTTSSLMVRLRPLRAGPRHTLLRHVLAEAVEYSLPHASAEAVAIEQVQLLEAREALRLDQRPRRVVVQVVVAEVERLDAPRGAVPGERLNPGAGDRGQLDDVREPDRRVAGLVVNGSNLFVDPARE